MDQFIRLLSGSPAVDVSVIRKNGIWFGDNDFVQVYKLYLILNTELTQIINTINSRVKRRRDKWEESYVICFGTLFVKLR